MNIIKKNKPKVLLASMPWTNLVEPSLGLGILKSQLDKGNITCNIRHFNIFLLQYISIKTYANIANNFAINDFIFTHPFESDISIEQEEHCRIVAIEAIKNNNINDDRYNTADKLATMLIKLRNHIIPQYLSNCLEYIRKYNPTMIGFSCLFDQTIASIALAKIVKEYNPNIFIVLGGYAVDGIIGEQLIKSFSFIDCIAFGAGECLIEDLAKASIDNTLLDKIPNICYRKKNNDTVYYLTNSNNNFNINESPIPNYDDFVSDIDELSLNHQVDIAWYSIPIQTSCGCWWGERHQCVFCGINDRSIKYNYKKSEIVLSHITELYKKYNKYIFFISDYILPYSFYKTLLPKLAKVNNQNGHLFTFTCEIKANVKEIHFYKLKKAGFKEVQPGIESFSSNILKKMNKGVTTIQNIYCLMLGIKYSIVIRYNILFAFPDDEVSDYEEMLKVIPLLYHLHPPTNLTHLGITRDSPLQRHGKKFGLKQPYKYHSRYDLLFSKSFLERYNFDLNNYCFYFEYPFEKSKEIQTQYGYLHYQFNYWIENHIKRKVQLYYKNSRKGIVFFDGRYNKSSKQMIFDQIISKVYKVCECVIISQNELISKLEHLYTKQEIKNAVNILLENRLVYKENNLLLGLAFHQKIYIHQKQEKEK